MEIKKDKTIIIFKDKKELWDFFEIATAFSENKIDLNVPFVSPEKNIEIPYSIKKNKTDKK